MDCEDVKRCCKMIKPLKVRIKRLRLDPDTFRKWKMEMKKDAEIIEIRRGLIYFIKLLLNLASRLFPQRQIKYFLPSAMMMNHQSLVLISR